MTTRSWGRSAAVLALGLMAACDPAGDGDVGPRPEGSATSTVGAPPTGPTTSSRPAPSSGPALTASGSLVAGWWDGGGWVSGNDARPLPVSGGETYTILRPPGPTTTGVGSPPRQNCETDPGAWTVQISGVDRGRSGPGPVSVWGVAQPQPRPTTDLDPAAPVYREAAGRVLSQRGIDDPDADVVQSLRADLDGDGTDEVVVVAERIADRDGLYARAGDYSFVLLRRVIDGALHTTVVTQSVPDPTPGTTPFIYSHRVAAIADVNGDGRMELVLDLRQYEGIGVAVHELRPDGTVPAVLSSDCGA